MRNEFIRLRELYRLVRTEDSWSLKQKKQNGDETEWEREIK